MASLPWESRASRIVWSAIALSVFVVWAIFLFGGALVPFNTPLTFEQVLRRLMQTPTRGIWPGEFGHNPIGCWIQIGPWLALLLWPLCLVRWKSNRRCLLTLVALLFIPSGLAVIFFPIMVIAPVGGFQMLWGAHDGETWEDNLAHMSGMTLWVWLILALIAMAIIRILRPQSKEQCPTCGYSTIGLPTIICPECGSHTKAMQSVISSNLPELRELCRRHRVKNLWLFGSAVGEEFDPARSDLDFLVEFQPLPEGERANAYFGLHEELARLFQRCVDLVTLPAVRNRYFAASLHQSKVPLYAAA